MDRSEDAKKASVRGFADGYSSWASAGEAEGPRGMAEEQRKMCAAFVIAPTRLASEENRGRHLTTVTLRQHTSTYPRLALPRG